MTAAVLPQFVLLPRELLRCVFLLIADFGKYQVNRLKRIHFSGLDCQDFSPRAHPSPGRQREKESSCSSPKKQSGNSCRAPSCCRPSPQLLVSADVLEETPEAWVPEKPPHSQAAVGCVGQSGIEGWSFATSLQCCGGDPAADSLLSCVCFLCGREASCLSSAGGGLMSQGVLEH